MLKAIRNINFGWIIILTGIIVILAGFSMTESKTGYQTFLCFDNGCIYIQGITNIIIGFLSLGMGIYLVAKK